MFNNSGDQVINEKYKEIRQFLREKKDGDIDTRDVLTIKGLIRRGEARTACTYNNIPLDHCHFLDLPFYETGRIQKNPISEADVEIIRNLLREIQPHQIFVAGDLADPHGTHRVCTDGVFAAIDLEKEAGAEWLKDCRIWMYRGAWAEWEIENIDPGQRRTTLLATQRRPQPRHGQPLRPAGIGILRSYGGVCGIYPVVRIVL